MKKITAFLLLYVVLFAFPAFAQNAANIGAETVIPVEKVSGTVGTAFVLDGSKSQDDGIVGIFRWRQVGGPIAFSSREGATTSFTPTAPGTYTFELTVTKSDGIEALVKRTQV